MDDEDEKTIPPLTNCKNCYRPYILAKKQCPHCRTRNPNWKPSHLYPYVWEELKVLPRRKYLIKGLLDCQTLSVVYGESNTGKTFFALDIAAHIALGWTWRGKNTKQGAVVYIAAEGGIGLQERLDAFRLHHELNTYAPLHIIPSSVDLCTENNDANALIESINHIENIKLIVVDTLSRAMAGGNENGSEDMTAFIRHCDTIKEFTGAHILIVHHNGKDHSKGARGHSSLKAAVDTEIELRREQGKVIAEVRKQRDGATGENLAFSLQSYEVGKDEDGDAVYSCAVVPQDTPSGTIRKLSPQRQKAFEIIRTCILDKGQKRHVRQGMFEVHCITKEECRNALELGNISNSEQPDNIRRAISKVMDDLNNTSIISSYGNYYWIPEQPEQRGRNKIPLI